jgi:hypothetical protein
LERSNKPAQCGPFKKAITDITGLSPQKRRNGDMPVGYLGEAAIRREKCDMMAKSRNSGMRRPFLGKGW